MQKIFFQSWNIFRISISLHIFFQPTNSLYPINFLSLLKVSLLYVFLYCLFNSVLGDDLDTSANYRGLKIDTAVTLYDSQSDSTGRDSVIILDLLINDHIEFQRFLVYICWSSPPAADLILVSAAVIFKDEMFIMAL